MTAPAAVRHIDPGMLAQAAAALADEYLDTLRDGIRAHPRSGQTLIGPSEIGDPCARAVLHRLNGDKAAEPREPRWAPAIGTALHAQAQEWFDRAAAGEEFHGRWLTEQRVTVGTIGGRDISGSCDLWDEWTGAVIDHKFVSASSLKDKVANGPGDKYRVQAHLYGRGFQLAGKDPDLVMIAFVPRDGGNLGQSHLWWERYDPDVAAEALDRADRLWNILQAVGIDTALGLYEDCTKKQKFCDWCGSAPYTPAPAIRTFTPA